MPTLKINEQTIADAELSFRAKGKALAEIRDKSQFVRRGQVEGEEKVTFETYLAERWEWSRRMADRMIAAARVADVAEQAGYTLTNEGQARELTDLANEPEFLADILEKATEQSKGRLTALAIRKVRHALSARVLENGETVGDETGVEHTLTSDNEGEDWNSVLNAHQKVLRKLVRELPDEWVSASATMLENIAAQARKRAIKIAREG